MTTNAKPSGADALLQLIENYVEKRHTHGAPQYNVVTARARDAVLAALSAAQAVPDTREMFNAGWCAAARFCDREDVVYDGLVGPGGCPAFEVAYRAALSAAQDAPDALEKELLQAIQERDAADDYIDALLDEVLGTDRPEWSSVYGHADAIEQVRERINTLMKPSIDKAWDRFQSAVAPAAPQPAQQPLTDEQIADALGFGEYTVQSTKATLTAVARAIEQAATAPLLARIAELEAELEKTKAIFAASCNHAAVMEMDRDARRYRWLRVCNLAKHPAVRAMFELGDAHLDATIDAAMKEQGHG